MAATPTIRPLPKALEVRHDRDGSLRRQLGRLTKDGRARIVYDAHDTAQPVPHVGVVLIGRTVAAWIIATGWEDDRIEEVGALWSETTEAIAPADADGQLRYLAGGSAQIAPLVIRRTLRGAPDAQDFPTDVRTVDWQRFVCRELTSAAGMVEVIRPDSRSLRTGWSAPVVLVPDDRGVWKTVTLDLAVSLARAELRVPLSDLVSRRGRVSVETPAGTGTLQLESASDAVRLDGEPSVHLEGLISITLEGLSSVTLEAQRNLTDFTWTVSLHAAAPSLPDRVYGFHAYPRIVSGADAFTLVKEIARTFSFPEPVPADADATPAAQQAFAELLAHVHDRRRRLQFVLEAFGIHDKVQQPAIRAASQPAA